MIDLNVEIGGTTGKPDVVLLHGLGATHFSWHKTLEILKPNFKTYAFDLWGFGESWPVPKNHNPTLREHAEAVISYMTAIPHISKNIAGKGNSEIILIGHSMGGGICIQILDILNSMGASSKLTAKKVALIAPAARPASFEFNPKSIFNEGLAANDSVAMAKKLLEKIYVSKVPEIEKYAKKYAINFTFERFLFMGAQALQLSNAASYASKYQHYKTEAKLIWGIDDPILNINEHGRALAKEWPTASITEIKNCGHAPHEEYPKIVNKIIETFLKKQ